MKRDLQKAITDYKKTFGGNDRRGAFYMSDIEQIIAVSKPAGSMRSDLYQLAGNALRAGFMIGYRTAKREKRNI